MELKCYEKERDVLDRINVTQHKLFNDAPYEGVFLSPGNKLHSALRDALASLKKDLFYKEESWGSKPGPRGKRMTIYIPTSKDVTTYSCQKYVISYHIIGQGSRQRHYVNVYSESALPAESEK